MEHIYFYDTTEDNIIYDKLFFYRKKYLENLFDLFPNISQEKETHVHSIKKCHYCNKNLSISSSEEKDNDHKKNPEEQVSIKGIIIYFFNTPKEYYALCKTCGKYLEQNKSLFNKENIITVQKLVHIENNHLLHSITFPH